MLKLMLQTAFTTFLVITVGALGIELLPISDSSMQGVACIYGFIAGLMILGPMFRKQT